MGSNGRLNYVFQTSPDVLLVKVKSCLCCFRRIIRLNNFTYIFFEILDEASVIQQPLNKLKIYIFRNCHIKT